MPPINPRWAIVGLLLLGSLLLTLHAAQAETAAERQACRPDVFRFCTALQIAAWPFDHRPVYGCLQQYRARLSPACDRVLKGYGY